MHLSDTADHERSKCVSALCDASVSKKDQLWRDWWRAMHEHIHCRLLTTAQLEINQWKSRKLFELYILYYATYPDPYVTRWFLLWMSGLWVHAKNKTNKTEITLSYLEWSDSLRTFLFFKGQCPKLNWLSCYNNELTLALCVFTAT